VSSPPSLTIVIVSYNVRDELHLCLRSIAGDASSLATHVVVVDNGSSDGTPDMIRERWPSVQLIEAGRNLGFARANNRGIRATESEYVLLLNPDTVMRPGAAAVLVDALIRHPDAAAAGPRLVDEAGMAELSFGWSISPLGELRQKVVGGLYARRLAPVVRRVDRWSRQAGEREWVSGACVLLRRRDLEAVGLLDERFFMYTEDVDLCVQLRRRGRTILFVPEAEVLHLRGRSAGRNPRTELLRRQSQVAYYEKHHPAWAPVLRLYLRVSGRASAADLAAKPG
jgi:N-acetylglucosaminyl-diphospho-decaprenol L-rhamnosyltransferase